MSDAKHGVRHTPGPWMAHQRSSAPIEYGHYVTTIDGLTVCNVSYQLPVKIDGQAVEETRIANARLIAAAPDLLEVLQKLVGTPRDPNAGWRGAGGTGVLFACEYCHQKHEDCTKVPHLPHCPVPAAHAAISRATGDSDEQ